MVDFLCEVGEKREIYFLWRPFLRDPKDEMVLEVGVEAQADAIVTHNVRDFKGVEERFGIRIVTPGAFLLELEGEGK
jgi:predicted nucleic acid-binding protein